MRRFTVVLTLLLATTAAFAQAKSGEKSGHLVGTIVGRDNQTNQLVVAHEEVPGLMGAMTMVYDVRGQDVKTLPPNGTKITAMLHEADGAFWMTDVATATATATHAETPAAQATMPHEHGAMQHGEMQMTSDPAGDLLMRQASGTSTNPAAAPVHMTMTQYRGWMLMAHGQAFVSQVMESGPRGRDKFFSTNWVMGMADRPLAGGHLLLRSMLSLEPLTVGDEYPELFQTGETLHGRPIVDAQHPHDFFMELAAEYAHPLTDDTIGYVYAAPVGDPALGPVAFPHRASAAEIPQATLGHHVQDSTHIASSVLTLGVQRGIYALEFSGFHGQEPDENRWDIDRGSIDSWSVRARFDPSPKWSAQISTGHLEHPEALEETNVQRTTASVSYSTPSSLGQWDSSLVFGRNDKSGDHGTTNSLLAESVLHFGRNYVTGRAEMVDKDELFPEGYNTYRVDALTLGYTRDVVAVRHLLAAVGGNVTLYSIPSELQNIYGSSPHALYVFLRLRATE